MSRPENMLLNDRTFSKMSTEDLKAGLASLRASVTKSSAVSVEWLLLKPEYGCCPGDCSVQETELV